MGSHGAGGPAPIRSMWPTMIRSGAGRSPTTGGSSRKLCLEGFQSGLSWLTILRKRENFRRAFADFDIETVAPSVTGKSRPRRRRRHRPPRGQDPIGHQQRAARPCPAGRGGLDRRLRMALRTRPRVAPSRLDKAALVHSRQDAGIDGSLKALLTRGWSFVGPTTVYAFMQSMGLVNDHLERLRLSRYRRGGNAPPSYGRR